MNTPCETNENASNFVRPFQKARLRGRKPIAKMRSPDTPVDGRQTVFPTSRDPGASAAVAYLAGRAYLDQYKS